MQKCDDSSHIHLLATSTVHFIISLLENIIILFLEYSTSTNTDIHAGYVLSNFAYNCVGNESRLYDCNRVTHSTCPRQHSVGELRSVILTCMGQIPGIMLLLFFVCLFVFVLFCLVWFV